MTEAKDEQYVATGTVLIDNFPAYQDGDPVSADVVKRFGLLEKEQVRRVRKP